MLDILLSGLAFAAYVGLAAHFWNTRWRPARGAEAPRGIQTWERLALLVPLALHGALLYGELIGARQLRFGFALALSAMLWLTVLFYWLESFFYELEGMQPPALALAALSVPLPLLFEGRMAGSYVATLGFKLHLTLAMLAYSLFTIAILHALLMAFIERRLHSAHHAPARRDAEGPGPLAGPFAHLPPLLTLERLLFRQIAAAFVLLTLTLATGIAFSESVFGRALSFNHKTLFAILSWLTFAVLLVGRHYYGWRGRTALRFTLAGFVMLLLAYIGSRFVLEVILGRGA